jgi:PAS domain S-box-containing protein
MTIKKKLIVSLLFMTIAPILCLTIFIYGSFKKNTIDSFINKLDYITLLKADKVDSYFQEREQDLKSLQFKFIIKEIIPILDKYQHEKNHPEYLKTVSKLNDKLLFFMYQSKNQMLLFFNSNGLVLYSYNLEEPKTGIEKFVQQYGPQVFEAGKKDLYWSDIKLVGQDAGHFAIMAAAPLYDANNFLGVVALVINLDDLFKYLQDPLQLGQGWETVLGQQVDVHRLVITQIQPGAGKEPPRDIWFPGKLAEPIQKALQGETGAGLVTDHHGRPVIAAWRYLPRLNWGLVTKIDLATALAPLRRLEVQVLSLGGLALILGILLVLLLSRSIYQPIEALRQGVEIIGQGDLDHRVGSEGPGEISQLARAFDDMTARLKTTLVSRDELAREVLDRQRAEALAQKAEQEKQLILNGMSELVIYQDLDHRIIWANRAVGESLHLTPESLVGRRCYELWHSRQTPCPDCPVARARLTGCIQESEVRTPDHRAWLLRAYPVKDEHGVLVGMVEMIRDVTERRRSEAALRRSAKEFHTLVNNLPALVFKGYIDGAVDFYDDRIVDLLGYSKEDFASRRLKWLDLILPEDLDGVKQAFIKALKGDKSYVREYRIRNSGGEVLWVQERSHIFCHADGQVDYVSGVFYDITEQTQLQKALREQYHFVQTLLNTIPHPIFYKDTKGIYLGCNQTFKDLVGLPQESKKGKTVYELYPQDQAELHHQKEMELFKHPGVQVYEISLLYKDGARREVVVHKATFNNLQGELAGLIGVVVDITDLKQTQQALEEERRRLLAVLGELPATVYLLGKDYSIHFMNRLFQEKFGASGEKRCYEVLYHRSEPCSDCIAFQVFETNDLVEKELSLPGGETIQVYYYPFVDTDGSPLVLVMGLDITERKRIEAEVRRTHEEMAQLLAALP